MVLPMKAGLCSPEKQNQIVTVGDAIRLAREKAGWTQKGLAEATGLPRYRLGRWERNRSIPNEAELEILKSILPESNL